MSPVQPSNAALAWARSHSLGNNPIRRYTLIVFLWVPAPVRIERLRRRERERFGRRILEGGDMHEGHAAFLDWAARYDRGDVAGKTLARHEAHLAVQTCPVLELRGEMPAIQTTTAILTALS